MEEIKLSDIWKDFDFSDVKRGDIIQNMGSGNSYIIILCNKESVVASRTIEVSNESEWRVLK